MDIVNVFDAISKLDGVDKKKKLDDVITLFLVLSKMKTLEGMNTTGKSMAEVEVSLRDNLGIDIVGASDISKSLNDTGSDDDFLSFTAAIAYSKEYDKASYDNIMNAIFNLTEALANAVKATEGDVKIMKDNAASNYAKLVQFVQGSNDIQTLVNAPSNAGSPMVSIGGGSTEEDFTPIDVSGVEAGNTLENIE